MYCNAALSGGTTSQRDIKMSDHIISMSSVKKSVIQKTSVQQLIDRWIAHTVYRQLTHSNQQVACLNLAGSSLCNWRIQDRGGNDTTMLS